MPKTKHPLITIGITCFNATDTIARAIASAQAQDWPNCEIVVVDDGSTDGSVDVINKIAKADKRIKLYRHEKNRGVAATRNTIINKAQGEYIAYLDDDDEFHPTRLTKQYERLSAFEKSHPDKPVLCFSGSHVFVAGRDEPVSSGKGIGRNPPEPHGEALADGTLLGKRSANYCWNIGSSGTPMIATKTLRRFRYDPELRRAEDSDLSIRIGLEGGYSISVDEYLYKIHRTHAPDRNIEQQLHYKLKLRDKYADYLKAKSAYRFYFLMARATYLWKKNKLVCMLYLCYACSTSPKMLGNMLQILNNVIFHGQKLDIDRQG